MKALLTAAAISLALSNTASAQQCASSALHTACLDDSGVLTTKSQYSQWYLGHDYADNEFHVAERVPAGGLQVIVDNQSTLVRHEDGFIYALGGKFSIRKSHPLILPIYHTDDVAFKGFDVYMVKDNKLHWYDVSNRTLTSPVDGISDVQSIEGGETLTITTTDGSKLTYDGNTGETVTISGPEDAVTNPEIADVQPGGSYIITGTNFGDAEGVVSMDGFVFELKSWENEEVHIENPPENMEGYLVLTSADGLESNRWYVQLDKDAPSDTQLDPQVCPVTTLDEHVAAVTDAGKIVLDTMPEPQVVTETVTVTKTVNVPGPTVYVDVPGPVQELSLAEQVSNVEAAGKIVLDTMPEPVVETVTVEVPRDLTMDELLAMVEAKARESKANLKAIRKSMRTGKKSSEWLKVQKAKKKKARQVRGHKKHCKDKNRSRNR